MKGKNLIIAIVSTIVGLVVSFALKNQLEKLWPGENPGTEPEPEETETETEPDEPETEPAGTN